MPHTHTASPLADAGAAHHRRVQQPGMEQTLSCCRRNVPTPGARVSHVCVHLRACSASINTALRKDLAGLDMPTGSNAWSTVKCRPEAAHWPHLLPSASATLHSRRGTVACSWSATSPVSPAPPPAMLDAPTVQCAISKIWTGAISLLPSFPPCLSACTCPRWVLAACTGP